MNFTPAWKPALIQVTSVPDFPRLEDRTRTYTLLLVGICSVVALLVRLSDGRKLNVPVPLEGCSGAASSYVGAVDFIANARSVLKNAYMKYCKGTFKIPEMNRYTVIINRHDLIEEVRKAPDETASLLVATYEDFGFRWIFGEKSVTNPYHFHVVRNQLTRSLGQLLIDVRDEVMCTYNDLVPTTSNDWVAIPALDSARKLVCRASNRVFVGVPLCRDPEFMELSISFTHDVMKLAHIIQDVPSILHPIVGAYFNPTTKRIRQAMRLLQPVLEERFRMYDENGDDWPGKPIDMISWLIEEAPKNEKRSIHDLTLRMLTINFAAIHTTSNSFGHALLHIAAEPKYVEPIREEIEQVIKEEGWSKASMTKMWKLDSFMKESQRINGANMLSVTRKILSDLTLSDGTFLPAGSFVAANVVGMHRDESHYPDADKFDGFRFVKLREQSAKESVKHQMVNTSPEYLAFGHGRHACYGRFFAVNELKTMMACLILNYDVKAEVEGVRPENVYHRSRLSPNPTAKILLRRRKDA